MRTEAGACEEVILDHVSGVSAWGCIGSLPYTSWSEVSTVRTSV